MRFSAPTQAQTTEAHLRPGRNQTETQIGESVFIAKQTTMETDMIRKFHDIRQARRAARDARRDFTATQHLAPHILRDVGIVHVDDRAYPL
ncbi:hypothetical protein [Roseovarius sp. ZX-A-9]|uniref:hypothetical protein n=1 Tax=Roseovarius sp. ZX-A-9 TaxID=3014783 RepID=UPI00232D81FC|nr:hypothetical protein [Roseovarius sp. ZX-A-9]